MPKRQIVILALTGLVVLYGAYSYFLEPLLAGPQHLATLNQAEVQSAIDEIHSQLDKARPAPLVLYRLELAQGELPGNPFYASSEESEAAPQEQAATSEGPKFTYGGFVEVSGARLAIINGLDYKPGEELTEPGYYVSRIDRTKVVIERRDTDMKATERIIVPLKDDFANVSEEKDAQAPGMQPDTKQGAQQDGQTDAQ